MNQNNRRMPGYRKGHSVAHGGGGARSSGAYAH
jgi:hypothetical protein